MLCFFLLINVSDKLVIARLSRTVWPIFSVRVSHILLLFHLPKGSWNESAKYEKLGKYWSHCTGNRAITNAYSKLKRTQLLLPSFFSNLFSKVASTRQTGYTVLIAISFRHFLINIHVRLFRWLSLFLKCISDINKKAEFF